MEINMLEEEIGQLQLHKQLLADQWDKYGLLRGADDPWTRLDLALLLENQRLWNMQNTDCGDIAQFKRISIPLVRRIWDSLIINEIACVQVLREAISHFYSLDYSGINVQMTKTPIEAKEWKLKAVWSYEAITGMRSYNNLDVEAELTAVLAQEIGLELSRRCLTAMRNCAGTNVSWDFNTAWGDTLKEKYEGLMGEAVALAKRVGEKTGRGDANWIVASPEIESIFQTCGDFEPVGRDDCFTSSLGIAFTGRVNGFKLYKDPLLPVSTVLMGYKGNHPYDSGYFYCPHLLLRQTPVVLDPDSFTPRKGLVAMDAHRLIEGGEKFYATLKVINFIAD
jgi:hypothetical protein